MGKYPCKDKNNCSGCGLCKEICPSKCINMLPDEEGFLYPVIDEGKCVSCGACVRKCPANLMISKKDFNKKFYCASNKNLKQLKMSSSGGIFLAIANEVIQKGGYVAGCVYDENMEAVHTVTNSTEILEKMCGSKYVQSRAYECFSDVKKLLMEGTTVLFTGTACQVMAIKQFVGNIDEKLITLEILCHGVPSPLLLCQYVSYLEKKLNGKIFDIQFRNKEKDGWGSEHKTCVKYLKNGEIKSYRPFLPAYFSAFFYGMNLRESCYSCKYARNERVADLTVGDFWGSWYKFKKEFPEGISVICINTETGHKWFKNITDKCFNLFELKENEAMKSNDNYYHPVKRTADRDCFYKGLSSYAGLWKKTYLSKNYRRKILTSIYGAIIPKKIRMMRHKGK